MDIASEVGNSMNELNESDWKLLRKLKPFALERLCERIIRQVARQCDSAGGPYHERFLKAHALIEEGNDEIARAFNDLRRSTAFQRLLAMKSQGLIADDEFLRFSDETRRRILSLKD